MERDKRTHAVYGTLGTEHCPTPSQWARSALRLWLPMLHPFGLLWAYRHGAANMR